MANQAAVCVPLRERCYLKLPHWPIGDLEDCPVQLPGTSLGLLTTLLLHFDMGRFAVMVSCRAEPSSPQPPALPAAASSPATDTASQAIWSPDTPEYIPQFTCKYDDDEDGQHGSEAQDMQHEPGSVAVSKAGGAVEGQISGTVGGGGTAVHKPSGYGSSSFTPLAGRRPAS